MRPQRSAIEPVECRSCGELVLWVEWERSGKKMPIDVGSVSDGDILVMHRPAENKLVATRISPDAMATAFAGRNKYKSHFATCHWP